MNKYIAVGLCGIIISGCATVNRGATDYFRIDSVPQGAKASTTIETSKSKLARRKNPDATPVYHGCEPTPCAIPLPRLSEFIVSLEHPGYEPTELFITNSANSGAFVANTSATLTSGAGVLAGNSALTSLAVNVTTQVSAAFIGGLANVASSGAISAQGVVASAAASAPSSGSVLASSLPPALAVTGVMLAVDAGTGANHNLFPNPVLLGLTPQGEPTKTDPTVIEFKKILTAEEQVFTSCTPVKKNHPSQIIPLTDSCKAAKSELKAVRKRQKEVIKKITREIVSAQK